MESSEKRGILKTAMRGTISNTTPPIMWLLHNRIVNKTEQAIAALKITFSSFVKSTILQGALV
jgi:hypothetical protein